MKITVLSENTSRCGLPAEHGLSLFVETAGCRFLFDMGQGDLFARNAETLGIDLGAADFAVLSHGHYDHGGGLAVFLALNRRAPVYVSPHAFEPHWHGPDKYIGLDPALRDSPRLVPVGGERSPAPGVTVTACPDLPQVMDFGTGGLETERDGVRVPEDFRHEQYLLAEEGGKRVLFSGCSHRGILNIVSRFRPDVLVGGFHLSKRPLDGDLARVAAALDAFPTAYYTCHCTGEAQYRFLRERMKALRYLGAGDTLVL